MHVPGQPGVPLSVVLDDDEFPEDDEIPGVLNEFALAFLRNQSPPAVTESPDTIAIKTFASVLLRAIVERGAKTSEGELITLVAPAWFEILRRIETDPAEIFQIPWRAWEEIIAGAYKQSGFDQVTLTPRTGDGGQDRLRKRTTTKTL